MNKLILCILMYLGVGIVVAFEVVMQNLHRINLDNPDDETCEEIGKIVFTWPAVLFWERKR